MKERKVGPLEQDYVKLEQEFGVRLLSGSQVNLCLNKAPCNVLYIAYMCILSTLTSSDSNTWQIILYCFLPSGAPGVVSMQSCEAVRGMRRLAIRTTMFPMSAMYEMVRNALSIMVSYKTQTN